MLAVLNIIILLKEQKSSANSYGAILLLRSRADLNRCTSFCRALPSRSATGPFSNSAAKIRSLHQLQQIHFILCQKKQFYWACPQAAQGVGLFHCNLYAGRLLMQLITCEINATYQDASRVSQRFCFLMQWLCPNQCPSQQPKDNRLPNAHRCSSSTIQPSQQTHNQLV